MRVDERRAFAGAAMRHGARKRRIADDGIGSVDLFEMEVGETATRREMFPPAVCTSTGTEMAYPLSSTTNMTGSFRLEAVFSDSQNSPSLVVPSPRET